VILRMPWFCGRYLRRFYGFTVDFHGPCDRYFGLRILTRLYNPGHVSVSLGNFFFQPKVSHLPGLTLISIHNVSKYVL